MGNIFKLYLLNAESQFAKLCVSLSKYSIQKQFSQLMFWDHLMQKNIITHKKIKEFYQKTIKDSHYSKASFLTNQLLYQIKNQTNKYAWHI